MSQGLVTVILPVYNAGEYLKPAVASVLSQSYRNIELIIVNDGSTDGCTDFLSSLQDKRVSIINQPNGGKAVAVNTALQCSSGEFWALQDADDLSYPRRIESQVKSIQEDNTLAAVFVGTDILMKRSTIAPSFFSKSVSECKKDIDNFRIPAHDATGLYRVSLVKDLKMDAELRIGQGVDYIFRVGERFPIKVIEGCYYSHRINSNSVTHKDPVKNTQQINLVRYKACTRRGWDYSRYEISVPKRQSRLFKHRGQDTIVSYAVQSVGQLKKAGLIRKAFDTAIFSVCMHPFDPLYYKPLFRLIVPDRLIPSKKSK